MVDYPTSANATTIILGATVIALRLAIALLLLRRYLRTREIGFVWLGVAVVIWPLMMRFLVDRGLAVFIGRVINGQSVGFYPFNLVRSGQLTIGELVKSIDLVEQLVGVCLLLVAVLYLRRNLPAARQVSN